MLSAVKNFAITFCVAVLIFSIIAYFIVGFTVKSIINPTTDNSTDTTTSDIDKDPNDDDINGSDKIRGKTFTALIVGTDYQPEILNDYNVEDKYKDMSGFPKERNRKIEADSITLIRVDKESKKFIFVSIPKDMRLLVDGVYISAAEVYDDKGIDFLSEKMTAITGLHIDYYAVITIPELVSIVDIVDGVSFDVPKNMSYIDESQDLEINLKKGVQMLDGEKVMQMLRYISYTDGNVSRMKVSINFLNAILAKMTDISYLNKAPTIFNQLTKYIKSNFTTSILIENLDLIFSYPKFEMIEIQYPGSFKIYDNNITYFDPNISDAIKQFNLYRNPAIISNIPTNEQGDTQNNE